MDRRVVFSLTGVGICGIIGKSASSVWKEVGYMEYILTFFISVAASVVSYYICKWIDRK